MAQNINQTSKKLPNPINIASLSEAEFNKELEKGYAQMQTGQTKNTKKVFADIPQFRKSSQSHD